MKKIRKAIIPAAGFGTRFLPATKAVPKEMLPIVDKPTIQYIVEEAVASGIEEILIITNCYKACIENHFDNSFELEKKPRSQWRHGTLGNGKRYCIISKCIQCTSKKFQEDLDMQYYVQKAL